ncbi:hypothetical protein [Aeromonas veronii]|nr:hypothetical protein [Aeromonas veronii]
MPFIATVTGGQLAPLWTWGPRLAMGKFTVKADVTDQRAPATDREK